MLKEPSAPPALLPLAPWRLLPHQDAQGYALKVECRPNLSRQEAAGGHRQRGAAAGPRHKRGWPRLDLAAGSRVGSSGVGLGGTIKPDGGRHTRQRAAVHGTRSCMACVAHLRDVCDAADVLAAPHTVLCRLLRVADWMQGRVQGTASARARQHLALSSGPQGPSPRHISPQHVLPHPAHLCQPAVEAAGGHASVPALVHF